ncbi:MAG: PilZ domain-containing protein [Desulfobulbaceae bacterium]|nr:PilZ domain-containing protein [Desulfobulbaceae bacterium]
MRKERRKHFRLLLNFKVKLEMPRRKLVLRGNTLNLSFAGAFIGLDPVPLVLPNEYFSLTLLGQVEFTCRVIHYNADGIGCQFDFIQIRYYELFKKMLLRNAPDPERIVKEIGVWAEKKGH